MKHTLLVVDDNEIILALLKAILEKNYNLFTASDGVEAMFLLSHGMKPDLIITDLNMDNINGYELVRHLSTSTVFNRIPVVVLSGHSEEEDLDPLRNQIVIAKVLNKPFDPKTLVSVIKEILCENFLNKDYEYPILKRLN